jgi:F420-0:gamma-glutamyl ligase
MGLKSGLALAKKIVSQAEQELAKERETKLTERAKELLKDIQEAKRTVALLEKQMQNFLREVSTD